MVQVNGGDEITPDDAMSDYIDPGKIITFYIDRYSYYSWDTSRSYINQ